MTAPRYAAHDLDAELVFDRFLGPDDLDRVQQLLVELLPSWTSNLRIRRSGAAREEIPIDVGDTQAFAAAVLAGAGERGETYRRLVEQSGPPVSDRFFGSVELWGGDEALTLIVAVDQRVASPLGPRTKLGNRIALQLRGPTIEAEPAAEWLRRSFVRLCDELAPAWAAARHPGEYWAKVMNDGPGAQAIGRDFGRYLPGVFWLNFFGRAVADLVGKARLIAAPASEVVPADGGAVVVRGDDPRSWDDPEVAALEYDLLAHLGADLFFSKGDPDRPGRVPAWGKTT